VGFLSASSAVSALNVILSAALQPERDLAGSLVYAFASNSATSFHEGD